MKRFLEDSNHIEGDLDIACDDILKLINMHQDFLFKEENLKLLAYIICRWDSLYNNSRIVYGNKSIEDDIRGQCENSPKMELENGHIILYKDIKYIKILKNAWKTVNSETHTLELKNHIKTNEFFENLIQPVYDEWDKIYHKKDKTMDEWKFILNNKKNKYYLIYYTDFFIENHLLCSTGGGYKWNKRGFIDNSTKSSMFGDFLYAKDELPSFIKEPLWEILYRPKCEYANNKAWEINESLIDFEIEKKLSDTSFLFQYSSIKLSEEEKDDFNKLSNKEKYSLYTKEIDNMILNRQPSVIKNLYDINKLSRFINAPKNADNSYVDTIIKIVSSILKNKDDYTSDDIDMLNKFIYNNRAWFRKKTIDNLLKNI